MAPKSVNAFQKARIALITLAFLGSTAGIVQAAESYGAAGDTVWLEQGWSPFDRDWYYYQTQGAEIIPYAFFLNLEQTDSEVSFRDDAHMNELGFTPMPPSPSNPDGLPMGFTKDGYGDVVGVNCAACHNGQVDYQGKRIIIDGGEPLIDFPAFLQRLSAALQATLDDDAKFERFARRMLKADYKPDSVMALRRDLEAVAAERADYDKHQFTDAAPAGHGRLDAITMIFNQTLALTGVPDNRLPIIAPVSYPHIWDTSLMDFVQYDGDVGNAGTGSLDRNAGEVVGVFARIEGLESEDLDAGYPSSIRMHDLVEIEDTLKRLTSPKWPAFFPPVDQTKAARGEQLYAENCAGCHEVIDSSDPDRRIVRPFYKPELIGTETARLEAVQAIAPMGIFEGRKEAFTEGRALGAEDYAVSLLVHLQEGIKQANLSPELAADVVASAPFEEGHQKAGDFNPSTPEDPLGEFWAYGARPLNGIWATAPFLNNGSVPNLYQLLLPADQRAETFYVKSREFDPVNVGFETEEVPGAFLFDTSQPANSNAGHEFGTDLSDAERWELIEYLKTL